MSEVDRKLLENIPGLRVFDDGNGVGSSDAMAVVAKRTSKQAPEQDHSLRVPFKIEGLRDYQQVGVLNIVERLNTDGGYLLADDMGLGKTAQTLFSWVKLGGPQLLIACPASVKETWRREIKKWLNKDATVIKDGDQALSISPLTEIAITSYELATKLSESYSPSMLVIDEAHNLRGRGAKRSRKLLEIGQSCNFRLALTGTPIWSRPRDLWMLLRILFPSYRFGTSDEFDFAYCGAHFNQWGGKVNKGATRADELKLRLNYVMLRRTKEDVASELPEITRIIRWVQPQEAPTRVFQGFHAKKCSAYDALVATLEYKLDAAVEAASETDGRFLLFTWEKKHAIELHRRLNQDGINCLLVTGDYSQQERNNAIAEAARSKQGLVATIDSCGTGVDGLQHVASVGIFHALDYVPIKLAQAEARLHRIGQTLPVTWIYLALEQSMDAMVVDTVVEKLDQWRAVMGRDSTGAIRDDMVAEDIRESERLALKAIYDAMEE